MTISNQEHKVARVTMTQNDSGFIKEHVSNNSHNENDWINAMAEQGEPEVFEDIRDRFIIVGNNSERFDHTEFARWLIHESGEYFATMSDSDSVYYYQDGIYVDGGESKIISLVEEVMDGYLMTVRNRNEVVGHIRALTRTNRDAFDIDTDIVNMQNGLYHINTGGFSQHTPEYLSLSKMSVKFDPGALCPAIDAFIKDVVEPHRVDAMYEIAGYAIMPRKKLKRGAIFVGQPDTGKSTMISLVATFVGESRVSDVSPIVISNEAHATFDVYGKMLNRIDDLGETPIIETGLLKSLISSKPLRANPKYGKPFSFTPTVFTLFGCNQVPECTDIGMMDKFDIFMFNNTHEGKSIDLDLDIKITTDTELSGLFNKAMSSVKVALENRTFTGAYMLEDRQKQYIYLSNPIARFVDECCDISDPEATMPKRVFRKAYVEWSKKHNIRVIKVEDQTTYLQNKGVMLSRIMVDGERDHYYVGIEFSYGVANLVCQWQSSKPTINQVQEDESGFDCHTIPPIVGSVNKKEIYSKGEERGLDYGNETAKPPTDSEKPLVSDFAIGKPKHTKNKISDPDTDNKLKHAVGKAVAKSDTMGAEVSMIVECYPESISTSCIHGMLEERGGSLGIKERYGKWYV
jgi:putative DNA primase/helicase